MPASSRSCGPRFAALQRSARCSSCRPRTSAVHWLGSRAVRSTPTPQDCNHKPVGSWAAGSLLSADRRWPAASSPPSRRVTRTLCWVCLGAQTKPRSSRPTSAPPSGTTPTLTSRRAPPCASARSPKPTTCCETPRGAAPSTPAVGLAALGRGLARLAGSVAVRGLGRGLPGPGSGRTRCSGMCGRTLAWRT